jgi:hypothetical protein
VEIERAGFVTYDRAVLKLDPERVAPWNKGIFATPPSVTMVAPTGATQSVLWRNTVSAPLPYWMDPDFDDATWTQAPGGFGQGVAGVTIRTPWSTPDIWLRREFTLGSAAGVIPVIRMRHDDDVEVYLNGVLAVNDPGWCSAYWDFPVLTAARSALRAGRNVLAIHCHNNTGGQFVDAGVGTETGTP